MSVAARTLVAGTARGEVLRLEAPLSFWGGLDVTTGRIIDRHHPQHGAVLAGRVVVLPAGRGSSSSSSVLAEAVRLGTAPAALVMGEADGIVALGAIVAAELYGTRLPVVVADAAELTDGTRVRVTAEADAASIDPTP
ncbi:MAG: aconitase X swivel domain-containing protein [Nitriliruptorales bacterium]